MKGSTGTSTNGRMVKGKTNRVKCNCDICVHNRSKGKMFYCRYYDSFSRRKSCARFGKW